MSFTVPINSIPYEGSFQGPLEPQDITDSSPPSLYVLTAKYIVQNISKISINRKLPSEICDNLIELFRIYGSKKVCKSFLYALSSKQCSVVSANLSNLDITDDELFDFIDAQGKTLRSLNISNCNRLSANVLMEVNRALLKAQDVNKLSRLVTIYEVPLDHEYPVPRYLHRNNYPYVIKKFYHNGTVRTDVNRNYDTACPESYKQNSCFLRMEAQESLSPTIQDNVFVNMTSSVTTFEKKLSKKPKTNYELHREMGLFCDPYFTKECLFDMEPASYACYDRLIDDHTSYHSGTSPCPVIKATQILKSPQSSLFPDENIDPNQCPYCYGSGLNRQKIMILPRSIYNSLHFFRKFNYNKVFPDVSDEHKSNVESSKPSYLSDGPNMGFSDYDNDFYFEPTLVCSIHKSKLRRMPLRLNELSYALNTFTPRHLLNNCDNYLCKPNRCFLKYHLNSLKSGEFILRPKDPRITERSSAEDYSSQIDTISETLDSEAQSPSMSTAATSSSCPILSTCVEAAYFNFESNQLPDESMNLIDDSSANDNNHNFPQFLKKFRPHSHNKFDDQQSQCSPSGNQMNPISSNNNTSSPSNFSPTSSNSFVSSDSSNSSNESNSFEHDNSNINETNAFEINTHELTCPLHPSNCPPEYDYFDFSSLVYNTEITEDIIPDLILPEELLRFELFPYKVYRIEVPGYPFARLVEIITWSSPSLESLSVTRPVPNNLEHMPPEIRQSLILHRDLDKLSHLTIHDWQVNMQDMFFKGCKYLDRITYLDLSHCQSIGDGHTLSQMSNLETLILYNVKEIYRAINSICSVKALRSLDISNSGDQTANICDPILQLRNLISSLPKLISLDISGTNLAVGIITCLAERENNPLEFLGISHTNMEPSSRDHIPAIKIAGDNFEDLILNSCEAYMNRPEMLRKCLNELFQIFRYENVQHDLERTVKILVCALGRHPNDKMIQVAASATLFYIIKSDEAKLLLGRKIKELIVTRLLDAMQTFRFDHTMLRNGCLNLIHFRIPSDVISEYTRLADILLHIVTIDEEEFVQRLGIYLLNSLACQVDGEQKTIVGNLGAIEKMLHLIEARYNRNICDEVMETAWSTMWNVTDETPINCERFLNNNGMEFFVSCMGKFPDHPELLRNMMGLLGNVSECAHLRFRLMKEDYINRFVQLLDSQSDGIEVSYNSAGILAHIASDGAEIWNRHLPTCNRDEMLSRMELAISRWEINSKRNINYRSFEPILRLLRVLSISWQAQYWAVWALANLTRVHSTKYCPLLEKDGGVEVLKSFIISPRPDNFALPVSVKCLAIVTLFQYYLYNRCGNLKFLEKSNEIVCFELIKFKVVIDFLKKFGFVHLAQEIGINFDVNQSYSDENDSNKDVMMDEIDGLENPQNLNGDAEMLS